MKETCWTCRFWEDDGYDLSTSSHRGPCCRYPDTIIKGAAEGCGEWKPREEEMSRFERCITTGFERLWQCTYCGMLMLEGAEYCMRDGIKRQPMHNGAVITIGNQRYRVLYA